MRVQWGICPTLRAQWAEWLEVSSQWAEWPGEGAMGRMAWALGTIGGMARRGRNRRNGPAGRTLVNRSVNSPSWAMRVRGRARGRRMGGRKGTARYTEFGAALALPFGPAHTGPSPRGRVHTGPPSHGGGCTGPRGRAMHAPTLPPIGRVWPRTRGPIDGGADGDNHCYRPLDG